jgi:exodeoxyribonuclease III
MAYRKKAKLISRYSPDLVVVPECESSGEPTSKKLWFGDNQKKGIGIFSYSDFELKLHEEYNPAFRYVIPIKVKSDDLNFNLFAVWAMDNTEDLRRRYIGQVYTAINYYINLLDYPIIIIGDFNWNAILDKSSDYPLYGNLSNTVDVLKGKGIRSAYHEVFREDFGTETKPTFFMRHNENKPYHIDYCFVSSDFDIYDVEIGTYNDWKASRSDHVPLIVTLECKEK